MKKITKMIFEIYVRNSFSILTLAAIIFISVFTISSCSSENVTDQKEESDNIDLININKIEISMEDAVDIAFQEASKYYEDLVLTRIHSYDNDYNRSITAGENGERQWWYVRFANKKSNFVSILIVDGEIEEVDAVDEHGNSGLINETEIILTAKDAVIKSKEIGLQGGNPDNAEKEWVSGFNFVLEYGSLTETPEEKILFLDVIGVSKDRNFTRVSFDAKTGELLLAMEKIEYEGSDEVEWKSLISSE